MALSPAQIAQLMRDAGFPERVIPTGVAVALAESSGDPGAKNPRSSATGLWQILDMHGMTPAERKNPRLATQKAYELWKGRGGDFTDWEAYNTGAHRKYLDQGMSAGDGFSPGTGGDYDTDPLPLTAGQYQAKAEAERAAQRQVQQAMLDLQRGRGDVKSDFQHFMNTLGTATRRDVAGLRDDMAARNLAMQPYGMGQGMRDIRDEKQEAIAQGRNEAADRLKELHRARADAQMQAGEVAGDVAREEARWRSDLDRLLGTGGG